LIDTTQDDFGLNSIIIDVYAAETKQRSSCP
jgi:hypothetical protein